MGSRDPDHAHFSETFTIVMSVLSLGVGLPNLKFVSLSILELLAFNAQKFTGSRDPDHAHFLETFVMGHVGTVLGKGTLKMRDMKMQDWKQTCRGWKMREWKMWHRNAGRENAGLENKAQSCRGWKMQERKKREKKSMKRKVNNNLALYAYRMVTKSIASMHTRVSLSLR